MVALIVILLLLAVILGGAGILEGLFWLIAIGVVLVLASAILGFGRRGRV